MRAVDLRSLGEAGEAEGADIDRVGGALGDQLAHEQADGGGLLEAGAAEAAGDVEAVYTRRAVQDRLAIRAHVVGTLMAHRRLDVREGRDALGDALPSEGRVLRRD